MDELMKAVKRHLKITWTSDETDAEISAICSRAEMVLNDLLGASVDYTEASGWDLDLYLNLCLYLYNGLSTGEYMQAYNEALCIARQRHVDPIHTEDDTDED